MPAIQQVSWSEDPRIVRFNRCTRNQSPPIGIGYTSDGVHVSVEKQLSFVAKAIKLGERRIMQALKQNLKLVFATCRCSDSNLWSNKPEESCQMILLVPRFSGSVPIWVQRCCQLVDLRFCSDLVAVSKPLTQTSE
jgi:hypothetical protein